MNPDVNETLRQKMELLDATETDPDFQPEMFWTQLDHQLHPPVRTRIWQSKGYWAHAAAFLIGGFLLAFWFQSGRPDTPATGSVATTSTHPVDRTVPEVIPSASEATAPSGGLPVPEPVLLTRAVPPKKQDLDAALPETHHPVPVVVQPQPAPEAVEVAEVAPPAPRALYLTDAAPQTTQLVAEKPQHAPTLKRPFFLSAEAFETQTALQRPASVWDGLRP